MTIQNLLDKYANGTINSAESSQLLKAAQNDPDLQNKLDELNKVDELLSFPKSEQGRKVIGFIDSIEVNVLAGMAGTAIPIVASQTGWLYPAMGIVGSAAVAGAIWLGVSSINNNENPASNSTKNAVKEEQVLATSPEPAPILSSSSTQSNNIPFAASVKSSSPRVNKKDQKTEELQYRNQNHINITGTATGNMQSVSILDSLLNSLAKSNDNPITQADLNFKIAMLYKQELHINEAKKYLSDARTIALNARLNEKAANALGELGLLEKSANNTSKASDLISSALEELRGIKSLEAERSIQRWENTLRSLR